MFTVFTLLGTMLALNCPEDYFDGIDFCCKLCSEGTFLKHRCNESKGSSFCEPCPVRFPKSHFRATSYLFSKSIPHASYIIFACLCNFLSNVVLKRFEPRSTILARIVWSFGWGYFWNDLFLIVVESGVREKCLSVDHVISLYNKSV